MAKGVIKHGERTFDYSTSFSKRSTLGISVTPDGCVEISAPVACDQHQIEAHLRKRATWIFRQLDYFEQYKPRQPPRRFVGGETHLYLGKQYRLKVEESPRDQVRLIQGYFVVHVGRRENRNRIGHLMQQWYRDRAEQYLRGRLQRAFPHFERLGCLEPDVRIRLMRRRWGSHSAGGTITLNANLIKVPTTCIDYVVVHELCHLIERYHDQRFFRLLNRVMPDWQRRKAALERFSSA